MKKVILSAITLVAILFSGTAIAQTSLASDQNPNYLVSQQKYMKMADSINTWHSTTPQETYRAIDYLEDKRIAREERRQFRRELRMERARWGGYGNGYYDNYDYPGAYNYYNGYRPWRGGYYRNNFSSYFWNTLPLATSIGLASWWWR